MPKNREGKTEEERLMLLQQRARAEEEMKKKKEEILTLFIEDKLRKEERNTAVNLLKLNEGWRSLLRQTRAGELRGGATELSQTFERQLDGLDSVVKTLGRDLQEAELQWAQVRRVHLQQAELLLTLQQERVILVQEQWEKEVQQLSGRCSQERKEVSCQSEKRRADVENAFTVEQQHRAAMNEVHKLYHECITAYQNAQDERKLSWSREDPDLLRKKTLQNQEAAEIFHLEDQLLTDQLTKTQQLIEQTGRDAQAASKLKGKVLLQRAELNNSETESQSSEQDLTEARRRVSSRTRSLREQLIRDRAAARKRLTALTVQSDNAAKKLKAAIAKGHEVLRVAKMVRKLEREQDVFVRTQETTGPETQGPDKDTWALQQLSVRMNTCVLQRAALRRRRDDLSGDNRQLRLLLRRRLDAMTVSGRDLGARPALLTVHRAPPTAAPGRHTVIEAAHAVKHSLGNK